MMTHAWPKEPHAKLWMDFVRKIALRVRLMCAFLAFVRRRKHRNRIRVLERKVEISTATSTKTRGKLGACAMLPSAAQYDSKIVILKQRGQESIRSSK
mmetsp:Transcript_11018/g.16406  ORF Transcript_11018/g.16406 Transcript_11018/m.16406 type:complete len:98 (+) Transcript_11018:68-361(+)